MHPNEALLAADGTPRLPYVAYDEDGYAFNDGEPLALNEIQAEQLFYAFPVLKRFARKRFPGAYVASDMFVYPVRRGRGLAPDIFVAFGAGETDPSGMRRNSYKLFEGEPVPSFVLEVLSGTTEDDDLRVKRDAYAAWGVREYWMFDPFGGTIPRFVSAERLEGGGYVAIDPLPGTGVYPSAVLGLVFRAEDGRLRIYDPEKGEDLLGLDETADAREAAEQRAEAAAAARQEAEERMAADIAARQEAERRIAAAEAELRRLRRGDRP